MPWSISFLTESLQRAMAGATARRSLTNDSSSAGLAVDQPPAPGRIDLCAHEVLIGSVTDAGATHLDVFVGGTRHESYVLPDVPPIGFPSGAMRPRRFVVSLPTRVGQGDEVVVRIGARDLAGSPTVVAPPVPAMKAEMAGPLFHLDTPSTVIENRLSTMAGWIVVHAGARDIRLLVDGQPQDLVFHERRDVADLLQTRFALGWQCNCDVAALEAIGARRSLRVTCEVDGRVIAERRLALRLPPITRSRQPLYLFMHVPKTAGTSVSVAIAKQPAISTHWLYHRGPRSIEDQAAALSPHAFNDLDLIVGHFVFGLHDQVERPCRYVAFLREPTTFLRSFFYYRRDVQRFPPFRDVDIFSALEQRLDPYLDNCFTRCFAADVSTRPVDEATLATAMSNMERHFAFVGLVERMEESVERLAGLLGAPLATRRENVTPDSAGGKAAETPAFARLAAPFVRYDQELYEHAKRLYWA